MLQKRYAAPLAAVTALLLPLFLIAEEKVDLYTMHRIRAEERDNSKVMDTLFYLTDLNGPRLTNSPNYFAAANWVVNRLKEYGINAKEEKWGPFGRSWQLKKFYAAMVEPQYQPLIGFPLAWTAGTNGPVTADVAFAPIYSEADMEKWKGKLKGKVVMTAQPRSVQLSSKPLATRWTEAELAQEETAPEETGPDGQRMQAYRARLPQAWQSLTREQITAIRKKISEFLLAEGVAGVLSFGYSGDGGTVFGAQDGSREPNDPVPPANICITPEHYNRIHRLLSHNISVKLSFEVESEILEAKDSVNVIGEIPGGGKKNEIVMLGAHLDSWHGGTGATDNAAGSAVMIEALRILKVLDLKMDRSVRLALWGGEEEGLLGSKAYVKEHFGDPDTMKVTEEHAKLSGYFNVDNGSGKIRGVYLQGNDMMRPIFEEWFAPFKDMGAGAISIRPTGGTDHLSFDAVGLPGFQFIQDELEYSSRTHHSNMDVYDHVSEADLRQAATIVAAFVYNTANRPDMLPRKPLTKAKPKPASDTKSTASLSTSSSASSGR
jgi:carboxypeptidase Q